MVFLSLAPHPPLRCGKRQDRYIGGTRRGDKKKEERNPPEELKEREESYLLFHPEGAFWSWSGHLVDFRDTLSLSRTWEDLRGGEKDVVEDCYGDFCDSLLSLSTVFCWNYHFLYKDLCCRLLKKFVGHNKVPIRENHVILKSVDMTPLWVEVNPLAPDSLRRSP